MNTLRLTCPHRSGSERWHSRSTLCQMRLSSVPRALYFAVYPAFSAVSLAAERIPEPVARTSMSSTVRPKLGCDSVEAAEGLVEASGVGIVDDRPLLAMNAVIKKRRMNKKMLKRVVLFAV